jgi:methylated-DNA-[protein]-cysteine S-methyltransferase
MTTPTNGAAPTTEDSVVSALLAVAEPTTETLAAAHARLEDAAADAGLLDVAYTTVDSPVGHLLLAATTRGLARVAFEAEDHDRVLDSLASRLGARVLRSPRRLGAVARELDEYFAGARSGFDLPLDFTLSHGFRQLVQRYLPSIGYGETRSYAEVARSVGRPGAVRAVGTACATNPLPVVVPCHRVLRSDGGLGGYLGGLDMKRGLLALEGGQASLSTPAAARPRA